MTSLSDLKVLDLGSALAAPYAAMMLADLGAEVIKIEKPRRGDLIRFTDRYVGGESGYFLGINRGKDSVTVDVRVEEGRRIIREMAKDADILIENFRSKRMVEWGLSYEDLKPLNPRLIYCSISGFGDIPGYEDTGGNDIVAQAYSGIMDITGDADGGPAKTGAPVVDVMAGMLATSGILAALHRRDVTGEGDHVRVNLLEAAYALMPNYVVSVLNGTPNFRRCGSGHPQLVPYQAFLAADGRYVVVGVFHTASWQGFCDAIERLDLMNDPRFKENADRVTNRAELAAIIQEIIQTKPADHWVAMFKERDLLASPVLTIDESFRTFSAAREDLVVSLPHSTLGELKMLRVPIHSRQAPASPSRASPTLGEHTEARLSEMGLDAATLNALREKRVI